MTGSARFPFDHLSLRDADALQILREKMTDDEVLAIFPPESQVRERIAGFLRRNARPISDSDSHASISVLRPAKATGHAGRGAPSKERRP